MRTASFAYDDNNVAFGEYGLWLFNCEKLLNDRDKYEVDGKITVTARLNVRSVVYTICVLNKICYAEIIFYKQKMVPFT